MNSRVEDLEEEVEKLNEEKRTLADKVNEFEDKIDVYEQYSKKANIIVNGLPYSENENVRGKFFQLAEELRVELYDYDIGAIHRLPAREGKIPGIVVNLNCMDSKEALIRNSRREKLTLNGCPIFIDEHLTKKNADILRKAKQLVRKGVYDSAWYVNGKIWTRTEEDGSKK